MNDLGGFIFFCICAVLFISSLIYAVTTKIKEGQELRDLRAQQERIYLEARRRMRDGYKIDHYSRKKEWWEE